MRAAEPDDLHDLHAILSDPRATRYWSTPPHRTLDQTRDWLDLMIAIRPAEGLDFVIVKDGRVIGKAGCFRYPEIGYILHPDCWGQGLAREALAVVIPRLFLAGNVTVITADVDPRNAGSIRLLTSLGFMETSRAERTVEIGGEWCDSVYFSLTEASFSPLADRAVPSSEAAPQPR
jgi:ribosomal-protein-alanine N-acetyltransferase